MKCPVCESDDTHVTRGSVDTGKRFQYDVTRCRACGDDFLTVEQGDSLDRALKAASGAA